jgi:hypothetical protein
MLFGAGKFKLAKNMFRQQMRSFASKQMGWDKMIIAPLEIQFLNRNLNCSIFSSAIHHCLQNTPQYAGFYS